MRRSPPRGVPLRLTIATLVIGLLVLTVGAVVAVSLGVRSRTLDATAAAIQRETVARVQEAMETRFGAAEDLLAGLAEGIPPVDGDAETREALAAAFVGRVRHDPRFEWVTWARADGAGIGVARRPEGVLLVVEAHPAPDGTLATSARVVQPDGTSAPWDGTIPPGGFVDAPWYAVGRDAEGARWTPPYVRLLDGRPGRACVLPVRDGTTLRGVLALGVGPEFIGRFVEGIHVGTRGRVFLLADADGAIRVAPSEDDRAAMGPVVEAAIAGLAGGAASLPAEGTVTAHVEHGGEAWVVSLARQALRPEVRWINAVVMPEDEVIGYLRGALPLALALVGAVLALGVVLAFVLARRVSSPLQAVAGELDRVGSFDLVDRGLPASRIREVAVVREATERMKASLRSFGRYVPTDLVRQLLAEGQEARLGGAVRPLGLFFSDVADFTSMSEGIAPQRLVDLLGEYLEVATRAVTDAGGTIDKFMGDGILAFFGAPREDPDHAVHACRAALAVQRALEAARPRWAAEGKPAFPTRIGLHAGEVVVGNIGTPERLAYTVIGDGVNLAARLESLNKAYGTSILASDEMRQAAGAGFAWRRVDRTAVKGRRGGGWVHELLGEADTVEGAVLAARDGHEAALDLYLARRFAEAESGFRAAAAARPGDRAALVLAARAAAYRETPPPADWDGVHVQAAK